MSTILLGVVAAAALACPAHMLWHLRRGHGAKAGGGCGAHADRSADDLRARQDAIARELAGREASQCQEVPS